MAESAASAASAASGDKGKDRVKKTGAELFLADKDWVNPTPAGELKDFSQPMDEAYHPQRVEAAWDAYWVKRGFFTPDAAAAAKAPASEKFVMVIPPPNVTGHLHIGHALTLSIEDSLTRWHRMSGRHALWVPGCDHAGIATQVVVEKQLKKLEGKTRHEIGREEFLRRAWAWKEKNGGTIYSQIRRLGASVDWTRERFTMDPMLSKAVVEAFVRMYNARDGKGQRLIFRSGRLVSWSCSLQSAISDIEVEHVDLAGPTKFSVPGHAEPVEFGVMHSFAYRVRGGKPGDELVVSTTRLETMLGDVAVAVHPDDPRYRRLHGAELVHPFDPQRRVRVVTDAVLVDMAFGTGAVKITPAHDPNDYECARRQGLPMISIFDDTGRINAAGGEFAGLPRFVARVRVEAALKKLGLYRGKEPNPMRLGFCSRSKDVVEPVLRPQWWVNTEEMAGRAVRAVEKGELRLVPEVFNDVWYQWLRDARPWCISRQLWWGHRIPAWRATVDGGADAAERPAGTSDDDWEAAHWLVGHNEEEARAQAQARWPGRRVELAQDEDVLDTWFSSGLFPFSVMGWPDQTLDLQAFYPGTLLETGHDILFFWVARMVMMGLTLTDRLPFTSVYLHSMVRDKTGEKMSKSKGNVIDPLDMITGCTLEHLHKGVASGNLDASEVERALRTQKELFPTGIAECGADALRFGLLNQTKMGRDTSVNLDPSQVASQRQFGNKIWNALRFAMRYFPADFRPPAAGEVEALRGPLAAMSLVDKWVLNRLDRAVCDLDACWKAFELSQVTDLLYSFWYGTLCDVYLEAIKPYLQADLSVAANLQRRNVSLAVLYTCIHYGLRLLHPVMPFLSDELFHRLQCVNVPPEDIRAGKVHLRSLCVERYPAPADTAAWGRDARVPAMMDQVQELARAARSVLVSLGLTLRREEDKRDLSFQFRAESDAADAREYAADLTTLCGARRVVALGPADPEPSGCLPTVVNANCRLFVPAAGLEKQVLAEVQKMEKRLAAAERSLAPLLKQTSGKTYAASTPDNVKKMNEAKMAELRQEQAETRAAMNKTLALVPAEARQSFFSERAARFAAEADAADAAAAQLAAKLEDPAKPLETKQKDKLLAQIDDKRADAATLREASRQAAAGQL